MTLHSPPYNGASEICCLRDHFVAVFIGRCSFRLSSKLSGRTHLRNCYSFTLRCCENQIHRQFLRPSTATLKSQSMGPLYRNTVIGTLFVDGWAVTFGTARRAWAGCSPAQAPAFCTKCVQPINQRTVYQCTNFVLFHMALWVAFALLKVFVFLNSTVASDGKPNFFIPHSGLSCITCLTPCTVIWYWY